MARTTTKNAVRAALLLKNRTLGWLARKAEISESHLSLVLDGKRTASQRVRDEIQKHTGIDIATYGTQPTDSQLVEVR